MMVGRSTRLPAHMLCPDCDGDGILENLAVCERCHGTGETPDGPVTREVVIRGGRRVEVTTYPAGMEMR